MNRHSLTIAFFLSCLATLSGKSEAAFASTFSFQATDYAMLCGSADVEPVRSSFSDFSVADIRGKWYYSVILYSDGSDYKLRNRQSGLDLNKDGTYNQNIWVGTNLQGRAGKYILTGKQLTLTPKDGKPEVYNYVLSADGRALTLKKSDGSGWKLEKLP